MSVQALTQEAAEIRRRLRNPGNAVVDRPLEMRNGRAMPSRPVVYIEKRLLEIRPQAVDTRETILPKGRHLCGYPEPDKLITVALILRLVAAHYSLSVTELISDRCTRNVVRPRQIAAYLARHMTTLSMPAIGRLLGGRDHTTILHAVRTIDRLMERSPEFDSEVRELRKQIAAK
jgi:hypothetical protein